MTLAVAFNSLFLLLSAVLLVLCLRRHQAASPEIRAPYTWAALALLGLGAFLAVSLATGDVADRLGPETVAALGAVLAPAWASVAAAHCMTGRRSGQWRESPALIVLTLVVVFTYGTAKALAIVP